MTLDLKKFVNSMKSFVIIMESKTETVPVSGAEQQIVSSLENNFKIDMAEGALPVNSKVSLQVCIWGISRTLFIYLSSLHGDIEAVILHEFNRAISFREKNG